MGHQHNDTETGVSGARTALRNDSSTAVLPWAHRGHLLLIHRHLSSVIAGYPFHTSHHQSHHTCNASLHCVKHMPGGIRHVVCIPHVAGYITLAWHGTYQVMWLKRALRTGTSPSQHSNKQEFMRQRHTHEAAHIHSKYSQSIHTLQRHKPQERRSMCICTVHLLPIPVHAFGCIPVHH